MAILTLLLISTAIITSILMITFVKKGPRVRKTFLGRKKIQWMVIGYFILILLATVLFYLVPKNNFAFEQLKPREMVEEPLFNWYEVVQGGDLTKFDNIYNQGAWELPYSKEELTIVVTGDYSYSVFIDQQPNKSDAMRIEHYTSKTVINGLDVTDSILSPSFNIEGNVLYVTAPQPLDG